MFSLLGCCSLPGLAAEVIAAAAQIIKMTTETAYDDKAYDQKMKDL